MLKQLSEQQVKIIAWLEFYNKYFFTIKDIQHFFGNKSQQYNCIKRLIKKNRIIKLNKTKYFLIPIKAKSGSWAEDPFVLADEICNGADYFIGGWAAANYWRLTEQIPVQFDIYTTKRQGKLKVLNTPFRFHRTTDKKVKKSVLKMINKHQFYILDKKDAKRWMISKE
jgi:predicted transcriptional regulator of viral defense system